MLDFTNEDHKGRAARANERETKKKNDDVAEPHRSSLYEIIRQASYPVKIKLAPFLAASKCSAVTLEAQSRIEGIGRPRVEASFIASVVDRMIRAPDAASIAAIHCRQGVIGRKCGASGGSSERHVVINTKPRVETHRR
jgi:cysteine synthase